MNTEDFNKVIRSLSDKWLSDLERDGLINLAEIFNQKITQLKKESYELGYRDGRSDSETLESICNCR